MDPRAQELIETLGLVPHPEGGFYRETFRATLTLEELPHGRRTASTAIYYLLPAGAVSALHRVRSDEVWHHYDGAGLALHLLDATGAHTVARLGRNYAAGERPQHVVPAGVWQAAVPSGEGGFVLCGCTVAPGFDFADFEMPSRAELSERFPHLVPVIETLTRGP
jgi:predicted cupin superfamily sugar epimerase